MWPQVTFMANPRSTNPPVHAATRAGAGYPYKQYPPVYPPATPGYYYVYPSMAVPNFQAGTNLDNIWDPESKAICAFHGNLRTRRNLRRMAGGKLCAQVGTNVVLLEPPGSSISTRIEKR